MFTPILPAPSTHASGQHQYGTRTRSNSAIKPSIRLRQSPDAPPTQRRTKPANARKTKDTSVAGPSSAPPEYPPFPPPNVVLHPEDASNKVFLALGRALVSINNHAITVKDLAELAMKFGLMCQNASAAGQAIATFIRNHYTRCNEQDDQPLLLKHHMSGTIYDDDLAPALYSRVGGAHCTNNNTLQNRLTNFRRGTQVWYLSKAAGAPCPFAAAGIRICDYNEDGKVGAVLNPGRERKRERDRLRKAAQTCGQKRKRLPRTCADKEDSASDSSDAEERPPKVKLTLRLRPCLTSSSGGSSSNSVRSTSRSESPEAEEDTDLDSDSDSESESDAMSVQEEEDEDEPLQPANAMPSGAHPVDAHHRKFSLPSDLPPPPPAFPLPSESYQRSMSLPYSEVSGSPPPDSEVEDDDYHITMTDARRLYSRSCASSDDEDSAWDGDFFGDVDADTETQWDSPGPRSPSVQIEDEVSVKQEPTDVRGLLDAWENLESQATDLKVLNIVTQAAAAERELQEQATSDDLLKWTWPGTQPADAEHIKQEDVEPNLFSDSDFTPPSDSVSPALAYDPYDSPVEECPFKPTGSPAYEWQWRDVELLGPDSVKTRDLDDGVWHEYRARPSSPEEQVRSVSPQPCTATATSPSASPTLPRAALPRLDVRSADAGTSTAQGRNPSITSPSLLASLTSLSIQTPTALLFPSCSDSTLTVAGAPPSAASPSTMSQGESSRIHTIAPLEPAISAIQFEGVPVYQMTLGTSTLLRRIDTGFVNISSIARYLGKTCPSDSSSVTVTGGSPSVCGTWAPLEVARSLAKDESNLGAFLSDDLRSLFPEAINTLYSPAVEPKTPCSGFGHQFRSASEARRRSMTSHRLELPPREFEVSWEDHLATHPPFILASSAIDGHKPVPEEAPPVVEALSPTEEEMFHVLCADPEWDVDRTPAEEHMQDTKDAAPPPSPPPQPQPRTSSRPPDTSEAAQDRPLRRSKRVANAVTTRSRTRSSKRGSRTSLS